MSTSLTPSSSAEPILCDTSFISVVQVKGWLPTWPAETQQRLSSAILGISVITIAEVRDGHISASWGQARRTAAEQLMAAYLWVPLDMAVVNECARLRAACRTSGVVVPDNDIWIAATANTRGWPLVSCDKHFERIPEVDHIFLDPPARAPKSSPARRRAR
ncbi:MAG TPA: type II toxin-antitoxin system VapC family toxin [Baekduia sp.]|nr:type II toxin-antitoxin system VapC family toxin [Baekduia sp.]